LTSVSDARGEEILSYIETIDWDRYPNGRTMFRDAFVDMRDALDLERDEEGFAERALDTALQTWSKENARD